MSPRVRSVVSAVLLTAACVLVPPAALSAWATYDIGDTGPYVVTMAPLASDPPVQDAVAGDVTDAIMQEIDTSETGPSGPMRSKVRAFVHDAVRSFTDTPAFRAAWNTANEAAHDAVMEAVRSDSASAVTIDLAPILQQVKQQLTTDGVAFADRIPVTHNNVTVVRATDLAKVRKGFHVFQLMGFWLPLGTVLLAVGGILLSMGRRRAVAATALGVALAGASLGVAIAVGRTLTLDDLPPDVSRDAAGAVYDALTDSLRTAVWIIIALGLAVAGGAWLTGRLRRRRRASAARRSAPVDSQTRVRA
ncbi:hypothetical protein ACWCP6_30225 [Streptomyces sp. NPDC002004]